MTGDEEIAVHLIVFSLDSSLSALELSHSNLFNFFQSFSLMSRSDSLTHKHATKMLSNELWALVWSHLAYWFSEKPR